METELKRRNVANANGSAILAAQAPSKEDVAAEPKPHPAGDIKHGRYVQMFRGASLAIFFGLSCFA